MARDLGIRDSEVHRAAEILQFWLEEIPPERRFVHDEALDYAHRHAAQIARSGRFSQRNGVLGRPTTVAEADFLSRPDGRF